MINRNEIWEQVEMKLRADKRKSPSFPDHAAARAGKVVAASGKMMAESMELKYGKESSDEVIKIRQKDAALETIVQCFRFLENLK